MGNPSPYVPNRLLNLQIVLIQMIESKVPHFYCLAGGSLLVGEWLVYCAQIEYGDIKFYATPFKYSSQSNVHAYTCL